MLKEFFRDVGIPVKFVCDQAREQIGSEATAIADECNCKIHQIEKGTPASNRAELYIRILKNLVLKDLKRTNCPLVFWDYSLELRAQIMNATARLKDYRLQGMVPYTRLTGQPCDISHICEYEFYEWVYFRDSGKLFPKQKEQLGRCLGPAKHAGNVMSQWILNKNGKILPIQTLRSLTPAELRSDIEKARRDEFDKAIQARFGDAYKPPTKEAIMFEEAYEDDDDHDNNEDMPEADDYPDYDKYINAQGREFTIS